MQFPKFTSPQDEVSRLLPMAAINAATNSSALDQGATWQTSLPDGLPVSVRLNVAAIKQTVGDETYTVKVQESSDGSTWVDLSAPKPVTAIGAMAFGIFINLRYQRMVVAVGGTSPTFTVEAFLDFNMARN